MPLLSVRDRVVHVRDVGAGEPVLLVHASSSSSAQWRMLQTDLASHFRTLAVDLLGYGATSAWDPACELTSNDELHLLEAVYAEAGEPIHLVGHSYGGLNALKLALSGRVRPRSLTLIEPIAFWLLRLAGERTLYGEIRGVADSFVAAYRRGDVEGAVAPYIDYWNGPGAWLAMSDAVRDAVRATAGKTSREWAPAFETDIPLPELGALAVPTLVMHGSRTNSTTRRICELIAYAVPGARSAEIPGGAHMCPLTHAPAVNRVIAAHIVGVRGNKQALAA
jgi:pimeloyl-ACP methyl ester carboxylesterase